MLAGSYTILLNSLDGVNDGNGAKVTTSNVTANRRLVTVEVVLSYRRLWRYCVLAYGCDQRPVTSTTILSKYACMNNTCTEN